MKKVINAFFSGTGFEVNNNPYLTSCLFSMASASETQINFGFNGCGVDYGFWGVVFGQGLDAQCLKVINQVQAELKAGHQVTLNVYGHSRGAIAALMLAKQLGQLDPTLLEVNLAMLDPVPGNLITTSSLDPFKISLANKTMNLSDSKTLKNVLALYPYEPLPDIYCHAPLLPTYPAHTNVDADITFGCHSGVEHTWSQDNKFVAGRFYDFLVKHGTQYPANCSQVFNTFSNEQYLENYKRRMLELSKPVARAAHSANGEYIEVNPLLDMASDSKYFNYHHQRLAGVDGSPATRLAIIKQSNSFWQSLNRTAQEYHAASNLLKWGLIGLGFSASLLLSGGFSSISLLALCAANIGFITTFTVVTMMSASTCAVAWQYGLSTLLNWAVERFCYPNYQILAAENVSTDIRRMALL